MTSGVAFLNRFGAAMAVDRTAATFSQATGGHRRQFRYLADKIFDFSQPHAPAGLMVFGELSFAGAAWGAIAEQFRAERSTAPTLRGLAECFATWLMESPRFDKTVCQERWQETLVSTLVEKVDQEEDLVDQTRFPNDQDLREEIESNQDSFRQVIRQARRLSDQLGDDEQLLRRLAWESRSRVWTGLTIVGFDREGLAPAVLEVIVRGVRQGRVQVEVEPVKQLGPATSIVVPIGRVDEVEAFFSGMHNKVVPPQARKRGQPLNPLQAQVATLIRDRLATQVENEELISMLKEVNQAFREAEDSWQNAWQQGMEAFRQSAHQGLADMSKAELSDLATELIELAITRHSLIENEVSGGDSVQCATVSREAGFQSPPIGACGHHLPGPRTDRDPLHAGV